MVGPTHESRIPLLVMRKLRSVEERFAEGGVPIIKFGCSDCLWVFNPTELIGNTLDEMRQNFERQCEHEFAAHECAGWPRK